MRIRRREFIEVLGASVASFYAPGLRGSTATGNETKTPVVVSPASAAWPPLGAERQVISLDGEWQITEGTMGAVPDTFNHTVAVPGLADLAVPSFAEVGVASSRREAFWYRRTFTVPGDPKAVATLKIAKAQFGTKVWLNGTEVGEEVGCYAPGYFDVTNSLRYDAENTLMVRVGAFKDALPAWAPVLMDGEVFKWIPGIYDSVSLSLMESPYIVRVQVASDIEKSCITVQLRLRNVSGSRIRFPLKLSVLEWKSGQPRGRRELTANLPGVGERVFTTSIKIVNAHLWSPEDPFLYVLRCESGNDNLETRFGMREFRYDPDSERAMLNGQPYYLRGCNFRGAAFFSDPERRALPWDREWVRKFLTMPKDEFRWNSGRVMFCRLPQFWYDLADEIGWLLQDEWPLWRLKPEWTTTELTRQFKQWMEESWNHPSIAVWDACNETLDARTAEVIENVRGLDLSGRPWDNSYGKRTNATDSAEFHAYTTCPWSAFETYDPPWDLADLGSPLEATMPVQAGPVIVNEIDAFWIRRDGSSLKGVFEPIYDHYAGPKATLEQRRECQAYLMAAVTEYWRARRDVAGVHGPFYLNYDVPEGLTSGYFLDVANLVLEPHFTDYMRNVYSPLAVMIDDFTRRLGPGGRREYRILVTNHDPKAKNGALQLRIVGKDEHVLSEASRSFAVDSWTQAQYELSLTMPSQPGEYRLVARLCADGTEPVFSRRNIEMVTPEEAIRLSNLAEGCAVTASSELAGFPAKFATDGKRFTHWSSEARDPQWLTVDLGRQRNVGSVSIRWGSSIWVTKTANSRYPRQYEVQASRDNQKWVTVARVADGKGGWDQLEFRSMTARYVRIYATARGERSVEGDFEESQNEDAQLARVGTTPRGVEEWHKIARYEREVCASILENREGFGEPRGGYDIWELALFEK